MAASFGVWELQSWSVGRAGMGHRRLSGGAIIIRAASEALWEPSQPFQAYLLYSKITKFLLNSDTEEKSKK